MFNLTSAYRGYIERFGHKGATNESADDEHKALYETLSNYKWQPVYIDVYEADDEDCSFLLLHFDNGYWYKTGVGEIFYDGKKITIETKNSVYSFIIAEKMHDATFANRNEELLVKTWFRL